MSSPTSSGLFALLLVAAAAFPALAQDRAMQAPAGQSEAGQRPGFEGQTTAQTERKPDDDGLERARAAARAADGGGGKDDGRGKDDGLERARAAARAADPRLQGLVRAPPAARGADSGGGKDCMSAREARGAIGAKQAVTLSHALRTARDAWDGEVIDYKLCKFDGALAYDLTLLNTDGRVARVRVDALNGKLVGVR